MPHWIPDEIRQIEPLEAAIVNCGLPRLRNPLRSALDLKLSEAKPLIAGLGGTTRALPVRQLLRALGFDEARHLQWRMEHKLVQALILRAWLGDLIPVTSGLKGFFRWCGSGSLGRQLNACFPMGYVIKGALGDSSGEEPGRDNGERILRALESAGTPPAGRLLDEEYVVQERIPIATEYRVHTLEDDIIEDLTFRRYEGGSIAGERTRPNEFVKSTLARLPDGLVGGSLLAWDIAARTDGGFAIIEVNFSGFHPVFKRGFHCSGYFHDSRWGACDTARLLNHVARRDDVEIAANPDAPELPIENRFYFETADWQRRHRGLPRASVAGRVDAPGEAESAMVLIRYIEAFRGPRRREPLTGDIELRLSNAIRLLRELAATTRGLLIRQALLVLGFDECRLGQWRLEHKLLQAHVFRHYAPESVPLTCGLDRLAEGVPRGELRRKLHSTFPRGFVIKTSLGDCSGRDSDSRTAAALTWIEGGGRPMYGAGLLTEEEFIVQERLAICREYRVHTIEDRVIEDLTVHRHEGSVAPGERERPNRYVQAMLDKLPAGITSGSNLGWDVALLADGSLSTVEVNIGGIHTVYHPGFHASGFFHHQHFGAIYSARLLLHLERTYGRRITVVADAPDYPEENYFYSEVADWKSRF